SATKKRDNRASRSTLVSPVAWEALLASPGIAPPANDGMQSLPSAAELAMAAQLVPAAEGDPPPAVAVERETDLSTRSIQAEFSTTPNIERKTNNEQSGHDGEPPSKAQWTASGNLEGGPATGLYARQPCDTTLCRKLPGSLAFAAGRFGGSGGDRS